MDEPHNPGKGGWPTIRYFNKMTGLEGGSYKKKTDVKMCEELGNEVLMTEYVEEYGNTSLCSVVTGKGCNQKQIAYIEKAKILDKKKVSAQLERLKKINTSEMSLEAQIWLSQRKKILKEILAYSSKRSTGSEELYKSSTGSEEL